MILLRAVPAFLVLCAALHAGPVSAHSKKEATQPADGAQLSESPDVIMLEFDAPMRITLITLTDANGAAYDFIRRDDMQPLTRFTAAPPPLPAGRYTVQWRGIAEDGHTMQGGFAFDLRY